MKAYFSSTLILVSLVVLHLNHLYVNCSCSEPNVLQDDILGDIQSDRTKRAATSYRNRLWLDGVIPYTISETFSNDTVKLIRQSMNHWQSYTCLDFVQRTNQRDYIYIHDGKGCCSYVGKRGGKQKLSLGMGCDAFGIIVHELGHAVGFWHEQSRPDRDNYVKILYKNVYKKDHHNFNIVGARQIDSRDQRYDFHSIMHYGHRFFSKHPGKDTIVPKLRGIRKEELGKLYYASRTSVLSNQDVIQTNLMYKCNVFNENGGTIFEQSGSFHSPNYPSSYPVSQDRVWIVTTKNTFNSSLTLKFDSFSVGSSDGTGICKNDYLDIRNGKGFLSPYLTQLCGNTTPDPITVLGESLYIRLHSELSNHKSPELKKGFAVQFKTDECSGYMYQFENSFSTPNFPRSYEDNTDCVWQITVPSGYRIKITFDTFRLSDVDNEKGCLDYIDIRDGNSPFSTFLGRFCGKNNPGTMTSTSASFRVIFHSTTGDKEKNATGFTARYEAIDIDECAEKLAECDQTCFNRYGGYICGCGAGYYFLPGVIGTCVDKNECEKDNGGCSHGCVNTIGGYYCTCPVGHYLISHGKNCTDINECDLYPCAHGCRNFVGGFECICRKGYTLNTESKRTCDDINECEQSPCAQDCANTLGSYLCTCKSGFIFDEEKNNCQALPSCGRVRLASSATIRSPRIPRYFRHPVECTWRVMIPKAKVITLYVTIAWSKDEKCSSYVQVYYKSSGRKISLKLCGKEDTYGNILIRSNGFKVKYHVESGKRNKAVLQYRSSSKDNKCKQIIRETSGIIQTPGFPFRYPPNTHCEWRVKNSRKRRMRLRFNFFDLEGQSSCNYDALDIRSVKRNTGITSHVGRYCGTHIVPFLNIDPGQEITLIFNTDSTIQRRGFHADYQLL